MSRIDTRDLVGGCALTALGLFVAVYAGSHYQIGSPARMGPGFFPAALGWVLAVLGGIIIAFSFRHNIHALQPPPFRPRAVLAVLGAVLLFSLTVERLGLVPATVILVMLAAAAEPNYRWRRSVLLALSLAVIAWLIFTVALQMQLPAFAFLD